VAEIEEPGAQADFLVLLGNATVPYGHFPAAEIDEGGSQGPVLLEEASPRQAGGGRGVRLRGFRSVLLQKIVSSFKKIVSLP